jgi:hypothetical protein
MPRWVKGKPPGPGRPKGCRNKSTVLLDAIGAEGIEDVIRVVQEKAKKKGNLHAAQILLDRLWPRGPRLAPLDLPAVKTAADIVEANAALIERISEGEVPPEQANAASTVIENQRRAIETGELEKRIQQLEAATAHIPDPGKKAA